MAPLFSQPNAGVCEHMLAWAYDAAGDDDNQETNGDLIELYCGNG